MRTVLITPLVLGTALLASCNSRNDVETKVEPNPASAVRPVEQQGTKQQPFEVIVVGPDGKRMPADVQQGGNPNQKTISGKGFKIELEVSEPKK